MKTDIIPARQKFAYNRNSGSLNLKAVCIFAATGFFLEKDTYYNNLEALQPASEYKINEDNIIEDQSQYWHWNYSPRDISIKQATEEFAHLFEQISEESLKDKEVILPLSGGIDSRTQAAAIGHSSSVKCYSYKFADSFDETKYGKEICGITKNEYKEYIIPKGYLWEVIDELSKINQCYADFTNPRQMAVINQIKNLGNIFYLGHWGDVLFDDVGVDDRTGFEQQTEIILKKIIKKSGIELAESLWEAWGIEGEFKNYLKERVSNLLQKIEIENANSRIRAFKSMYWAPRWTSANMNVFSDFHPVYLPYYDERMCRFICTIPEKILSGRQIQIEYIKMKNPDLASVPWQDFDPMNLYNYKEFESKKNMPARAIKKVKRIIKEKISGEKVITRNWEIQFTGEENDRQLNKYLFDNNPLTEIIPESLIKKYYEKFKNEDSVYYSHSLSMLLTLSAFAKNIHPKHDG